MHNPFKKLLTIFTLLLFSLIITACSDSNESKDQIKVGTISGPDTELMETAKQVAKDKYGLDIKIIEFSDYAMPNAALNDGSIDANMFQHIPYFEESKKARGYDIIIIGKTFVFPMGLYSDKIKSIDDVKENSIIAIPNDPTNEARALLLLQEAGLIRLQSKDDTHSNVNSIKDNPKNLEIKPLKAAQLPRVLPDVELAAITNTYAVPAGLNPKQDALLLEDSDSYYPNIIVIRAEDKDDPRYRQLVNALHSPEVIARAKELFNDQAIPAWDTENRNDN